MNKESALITGLLLFAILTLEKKYFKSVTMLIFTFFCFFLVKFTRDQMFLKTIVQHMSNIQTNTVNFHPMELINNTNDLFINNLLSHRFIFSLLIFLFFYFLLINLINIFRYKKIKYLVIYFILYFSIILFFGILMETRTQLVLLPICFHIYIECKYKILKDI